MSELTTSDRVPYEQPAIVRRDTIEGILALPDGGASSDRGPGQQ